jgi:hypothetical protein
MVTGKISEFSEKQLSPVALYVYSFYLYSDFGGIDQIPQ